MELWNKYVKPHRIVLCLFLFYFVVQTINLTLLPIFNDESIYLDWAWSYTHMPGHLYDSLLDAKQPLLIWIFGLFENFFQDPLFAGRFVSVLIGSATMYGIYLLTKKLLNNHAALIAALIYSVTPLFVFYNRQALMEAAVGGIGVWIGVLLRGFIRENTMKNSIILGILWGIGLFVKSSSVLFILSSMVVIWGSILIKKKTGLIKPYFIAVAAFLCTDFLLFINPVFWQTLHLNNRYAFSLAELFTFPLQTWFNNIYGFFGIGFVFVTPFLFLAGLTGIYFMMKKGIKSSVIFLSYFLLALFLELLSGKSQGQRYLVAFLPFLIIPASYFFYTLWRKSVVGKIAVCIACLFPMYLSFLQINQPEQYIRQTAGLSQYAQTEYLQGQTSGFGVFESIQYIKEHTPANQPVMVLFGFNIGNPESAVDLYSQRTKNLAPLHFDSKIFAGIEEYQCLTSQYPTVFVTRNGELLGMEQYFILEKTFPTPDEKYAIKLYTLKKQCKGKAASISDIYHDPMVKMFQMRKGDD